MAYAVRIVGHEDVDPKVLVPNPSNWREHPDFQRAALNGALTDIGWVDEIMVNKTTGRIIDGHLRLDLALKQDEPLVPVRWVELTPEEEAIVLITYDPLGDLSRRTDAMLRELIDGINTPDESLQGFLDSVRNTITAAKFLDAASESDEEQDENGEPTPRNSSDIVEFSLPMTNAQRSTIVERLNQIKADNELGTSTHALLWLCQQPVNA